MIPSGHERDLAKVEVYQRGLVIDSQQHVGVDGDGESVSKGIGD